MYELEDSSGAGVAVQRADLVIRELAVVADCGESLLLELSAGGSVWSPDDSPLHLADVSGWDLYALELESGAQKPRPWP